MKVQAELREAWKHEHIFGEELYMVSSNRVRATAMQRVILEAQRLLN